MPKVDRAEIIQRGQRAQQILADPLVDEAFVTVERELTRLWRETEPQDTGSRERLWLALRLFDSVRKVFEGIVASGKFADHEVREFLKPVDQIHRHVS